MLITFYSKSVGQLSELDETHWQRAFFERNKEKFMKFFLSAVKHQPFTLGIL